MYAKKYQTKLHKLKYNKFNENPYETYRQEMRDLQKYSPGNPASVSAAGIGSTALGGDGSGFGGV